MPSTPIMANPAQRSGVTLAALLAALSVIVFTNTDHLVESGFAAALKIERPAGMAIAAAPISGTEDFWLRQAAQKADSGIPIELVSGSAPIARGDGLKITIGGRDRSFEVVEIVALPDGMTHIETGAGKRMVMVTCRDKAIPDAAPLRLIGEVSASQVPALTAEQQRAL